MIKITIDKQPIFNQDVQAYAIPVEENFSLTKELKEQTQRIAPELESLIKSRNFIGKTQSYVTIPFSRSDKKLAYLIFIGLGKLNKKKKIDIENYRRALGRLMRVQEELKVEKIALQVPQASFFANSNYLADQTAQLIHIAGYHFDEFITDPERKVIENRQITLVLTDHDSTEIKEGLKKGEIVATSVNKARHWIDLPPRLLYPVELADKAKAIAKEFGLKYTVYNEVEIIAMGMGGLAGVSAGSDHDCQLVIMEYKTSKKNAPTIAFVGKGITFDSGGLSIKPAVHMETMKEDMSGAAAVIAAMASIAQLKPEVNVIGITPLSENLPSGTATKPGDILRFYNGKTAEVKNTDAEGRLILADALSYAAKQYKPDALIDIATLTGACAYALGPFYCGLMSEDDELVQKLQESSDRSGDRVWRLPLSDDYKPAIKSAVADLSNIGSQKYLAGAVTAALFLQAFVENVPWAHLDIAGVAFDVPDIPYYRTHSATGFGVRLLVDLAMNWKT